MTRHIRVRFAPSPTGMMHLGNVCSAFLNYLFAKQKQGTFILRIEDTDLKRNIKEACEKIYHNLAWLGLTYDEGPSVGGAHGPYMQSERTEKYQEKLNELIAKEYVYRCFCSPEELERKRSIQMAAKQPPRYDRSCLKLSKEQIEKNISDGVSYIWRFKIDLERELTIRDMAKGSIAFHMKNFSDFALARQDGTFTFIFSNFVDDVLMNISHVIRGEDHLTNTAMQAALYDTFGVEFPLFWHLPIICNDKGEKLSKRDFGFSLNDLQESGFLPEAILNYIASLGTPLREEIQSREQLITSFDFEHVHASSTIKYDLEKLSWFNHKWIGLLAEDDYLARAHEFIIRYYPQAATSSQEGLKKLLLLLRSELKKLADLKELAAFFFAEPIVSKNAIIEKWGQEKTGLILTLIQGNYQLAQNPDEFVATLQKQMKEHSIPAKELFGTVRYFLTGSFNGLGMKDLLHILDQETVRRRLDIIFI